MWRSRTSWVTKRDRCGSPSVRTSVRRFGGVSRVAASVVRDHGLAGATCVGVLSPEQYSLRLVDAPEVSRAELGAAARWLIGDLVDFSVDDAVIDFFEVPQQTSRGRPNRIYVVAAEARVVQRTVDVA